MADTLPPFDLSTFGVPNFSALSSLVAPQAPPEIAPEPAATPPKPILPRIIAAMPGRAAPAMPPLPAAPRKIPVPEPPKPDHTDPLKALGNPLAILAVVASSFVRNPAIAAGNAMAAAMEAQQKGDQLKYAEAYKEYTQQIQKVAREQEQENAEYDAAYSNYKLSYDEKIARMRMTAARRGDSVMTGLLSGNGGALDPTKIPQILIARAKSANDISKLLRVQEKMNETPGMTFPQAMAAVEKETADNKKGGNNPLGNFDLEGEEFLASVPAQFRDSVKAIAEGRQQVPSGKWGEALREAAFHYKQGLKGQTYGTRMAGERYFASGQGATNTLAINTMIGHMGRLSESVQGLNNSDWKFANKALNAYLEQSGDPRVARFLTDAHAVVDEASRVFKGTATEGEIRRWGDLFDGARSPQQLQTMIQEFTELLNSRLEALRSQRQRVTGTDEEILSPHARETYDKLRGGAPQPGTVMDGYRFKGGDPADKSNWEPVQ